MPLEIVRNDITKMAVDAIVNAANPALKKGGGVCGAIFRAAGEGLEQECAAIGGCKTGQAVITGGHRLPATHIIHTVGPVWRGGDRDEAVQLNNCYRNSLKLAQEMGCASIAFPLISSGIYGYPTEQALAVATAAISEFLAESDMHVYLVVYDKKAFGLSENLLGPVRAFISEHYVAEKRQQEALRYSPSRRDIREGPVFFEPVSAPMGLEDVVGHLDEPFSSTLFRLIDAKGMTDVEVYKRANIDRRLFSKIRSNRHYMPSKKTAVSLAVALELNLSQTKDLLMRVGYTLSRSQIFDVIIEYFITNEVYNVFSINEALFYYDQPLLGG